MARWTLGPATPAERALVEEVIRRVHVSQQHQSAAVLEEMVGETLFQEQLRLEVSTHPRAPADRIFLAHVRKALRSGASALGLLREIVRRYAEEIGGHFDPTVYRMATRALPVGLSVLMHSTGPRELLQGFTHLPDFSSVADRLVYAGHVEELQALVKRGTVILAPTHSSNLDSPLVGYSIYRLGLPPFAYGAGLNLFSNRLMGLFMHNLGAYTVDRKKTDPLYRQTLKTYATVALERGQHSLYFPGGTRSRSGAVERHLKKGLLGTSVSAFQSNLLQTRAKPRVFIVPCTCTYPLVLEAETLIRDELRTGGRGRYLIEDDEFSRLHKWTQFLRGILRLDLRIHIVVGQPIDPFGNAVDADGRSHDPRGREVDPARYLMRDGQLSNDEARDAEYTRLVAARLVDSFHRDTVALPTHVLTYVFLDLLRRKSPHLDLYRLLRSIGPDTTLPLGLVQAEVARLCVELKSLAEAGRIRLDDVIASGNAPEVVAQALQSLSVYHTKPVIRRDEGLLAATDPALIFFYRNRLDGLGLLGAPTWLPTPGAA